MGPNEQSNGASLTGLLQILKCHRTSNTSRAYIIHIGGRGSMELNFRKIHWFSHKLSNWGSDLFFWISH